MAVVDLAKQVGTTKGDLYVYNGSNLVRLAVGADDTVLTADSAQAEGVKWAAGGGGGDTVKGWVKYFRERLGSETSNGDDDFFTSDTSADYTAQTVSGTATWTLDPNLEVLSAKFANQSSGDVAAYVKSLTSPSAPVTLETAMRLWPVGTVGTSEWAMAGLIFTDGTLSSSNGVAFEFGYSGQNDTFQVLIRAGTLTSIASDAVETISSDALALGGITDHVYLRGVWINTTTVAFAVSLDGVTWFDFSTADTTITSFTPTHGGFWTSTYGGNDENFVTFEYLRRNDSNQSV